MSVTLPRACMAIVVTVVGISFSMTPSPFVLRLPWFCSDGGMFISDQG